MLSFCSSRSASGSDFSRPQDNQAGRFYAGVSIEQAVSASTEGMDEVPPDSPPLGEEGSGKGSGEGFVRRPSRRWTGRYGIAWHVIGWDIMVPWCGILRW